MPKAEQDSPKKSRHETPSKFQERAREWFENYAMVLVTLFVTSITLTIGMFIFTVSLIRKLEDSSDVLERVQVLERKEDILEVRKEMQDLQFKVDVHILNATCGK